MASVVISGDTSGAITLQSPAVAGTNTVNFGANSGTAILDANTPAFRNRIINGAMVIDQRNAGAAVTRNATDNVYTLDRWRTRAEASDGVYTVQQVVDGPSGFINSLKVTVTTADASIGATQVYAVNQAIEGYNIADLNWGATAASAGKTAQTVTFSFWVKSTLTGSFGASIFSGGSNRSYPFLYTISAANTWEQKSVTIAGDTSGTWATDNTSGLIVNFSIGAGSNEVGTVNTWAAAQYRGASGQTQIISTLNATWQVTGVQLEKGSTATSFDYRPYGTELALCQRYYQTIGSQPGTGGNSPIAATGMWYDATTAFVPIRFGVAMRTGPTVSYSSLSEITLYQSTAGVNPTSVYINVAYPTVADLRVAVASGSTSGQATVMQVNGGATKGVFFSAEL